MEHPSAEWREWRRDLTTYLAEHPSPPMSDGGEWGECEGLVRNFILIAEHVTSDSDGPYLHHITGSADGDRLPVWIEEGMLRSALRDVVERSMVMAEDTLDDDDD